MTDIRERLRDALCNSVGQRDLFLATMAELDSLSSKLSSMAKNFDDFRSVSDEMLTERDATIKEQASRLGECQNALRAAQTDRLGADEYTKDLSLRLIVYKTALEQIVRRDYTGASYVALEALRDAERVVERQTP